jgi:hypothetical protein
MILNRRRLIAGLATFGPIASALAAPRTDPQADQAAAASRQRVVATLFGQVTVRLPRFRCAVCGGTEAGVGWPSYWWLECLIGSPP